MDAMGGGLALSCAGCRLPVVGPGPTPRIRCRTEWWQEPSAPPGALPGFVQDGDVSPALSCPVVSTAPLYLAHNCHVCEFRAISALVPPTPPAASHTLSRTPAWAVLGAMQSLPARNLGHPGPGAGWGPAWAELCASSAGRALLVASGREGQGPLPSLCPPAHQCPSSRLPGRDPSPTHPVTPAHPHGAHLRVSSCPAHLFCAPSMTPTSCRCF